jgi:hypothetical protein
VTTGVRPDDDLESVWDTYLGTTPQRTVLVADGASVTASGGPSQAVYPKRSELRRAERAGNRRGADRRPAGSRPKGQGPQPGHPNHLTYAGYGAPAAERGTFGRALRPTEPRARVTTPQQRAQDPDTNPSGILLPRYGAAFPADQATPPRGVALPVTPRSAAVLPPPTTGPLPVVEPAAERDDEPSPFPPGFVPPTVPKDPNTGAIARVVNTAATGLPVTLSPDPAAWTLDTDAAPRRTGRRRGEANAPAPARQKKKSPKVLRTGTLVPGKGTAGAARLLVLALVVGFEGLAVTSLARTAQTEPEPHEQLGIIPESAAVLAEADGRQHAAVAAQAESNTLAVAHDKSGSAKVTAALNQVQAAQDRARRAAERREAILQNAREDPRSVARLMLADRGWGSSQFSCLNSLWNKESRWNYQAQNPSSGAYGIPQALPGSKMASVAPDWRTNPITQIEWGLDYIAGRYGTPCAAWGHSQSVGWY